jgi:hypothetical protein
MKASTLLACAALALSGAAHAADDHDHGHEHTPLHGGVVVEASDVDFELVAKPEALTLYVRDHGKPASTQGASGKITLLAGSDKTEAVLSPAGDNKLEAKPAAGSAGSFKLGSGAKAVASVTLAGKKPVSVRFVIK